MITSEAMRTAELSDAALVAESLGGKREAFRLIIERYQTLVSSLAYCATGDVGQSEDLAQETFVAAWKELAGLREPAKLRSWLCGIARFLISKECRRLGREPVHAAESLEAVDEWAAPEPLPPDHAISAEEKAILWRSLERIPGLYREPLVLFYREHQSIAAVARDLELSEDTVKQRLARGRKLLQAQFLAFVEGALRQTTPDRGFTLGVMAALPLLATTATAATVAAAATKGGSAAQATAGAGMAGAFITGGGAVILGIFGVFGFCGRWVGRAMGRVSQPTVQGRQRLIRFWRALAIGFFALVLPALLAPRWFPMSNTWIMPVRAWSLAAFCWLVFAALVIWECRRRRDARRGETAAPDPAGWRACRLWVILGMIGPLCLALMVGLQFFSPHCRWFNRRLDEPEARRLISERKDAQVGGWQYLDGSGSLRIVLPEDRRTALLTSLNPSLLKALRQSGIAYEMRVEGKDFHIGSDSAGWLLFVSTFIVFAGTASLLRRSGTKEPSPPEITALPTEGREMMILAVVAAAVMMGVSVILLLWMAGSASQPVSVEAARRIIADHRGLNFFVYQFHDGAKELRIFDLNGTRPGAAFAADESTLALLAEEKIPYETHVQGRDFGIGFHGWDRRMLTYSLALAFGAVVLFMWGLGMKPFPRLPEPASTAPSKT